MILEFIIRNTFTMIRNIMSILPTVPPIPTAISDGGTWAIDQVTQVVSLLRMVYSTPLFNALIVIAIAIISFESVFF